MTSRKRQHEEDREPQTDDQRRAHRILSSFLAGSSESDSATPVYSCVWKGKGAGKKDFKVVDFSRLTTPIIVVRSDSRLSNRATSGPLHLKFPLHGIRCQSEEDAIKLDKNCSAHRARYYSKYPGLARRLFCCQHIPFNVAIWWMTMPRSQSPRKEENNQKKKGKKDPPPDVLLIECLPKSNSTAQPERVLNLPTQEVADLAARVSDPSVGNSIHEEFHVIIRSDDVRRLQMWVEMYGLQNVANLDLYSYGFSLCQEAIRFYKPSVFHYLISLCTEQQERIFVHRGKRNNNSSPLHLAAYNARFDMVKALCAAGADVFHRTSGGFLPVHVLCQAVMRKGYSAHHQAALDFLMRRMRDTDAMLTLQAQQCPAANEAYCDTRPIVSWLLSH